MAREKQQATLREAFEEALIAEPDNRANHAAYADWLTEQDSPAEHARGEFIAVQLALEDESLPALERDRLRQREAELLEAHQREWMGGLAPFLLDEHNLVDWAGLELPPGTPLATFAFRRGWLDRLHVNSLPLDFARAIKAAPEMRLVSELIVEYIQDTEGAPPIPADKIPDDERWPGLHPLRGATNLTNVRKFRLGPDQGDDFQAYHCYIMSRVTPKIVRLMPRLEELYLWCNEFNINDVLKLPTLSNLRVLLIYHGQQVYRIDQLDRPKFRNLTHLLIHPHHLSYSDWDEEDQEAGFDIRTEGYLPLAVVRPVLRSRHLSQLTHLRLRCSSMGDEGCREIVASGILKRLKSLDLRHGAISDAGAEVLAGCPDLKNLEWLDLDRNGLSAEGIARMKQVGVPLRIDNQQTAAELHPTQEWVSPQYLYEGEFE
jgi:uncharacterized protein (TIGR02996 family)